jgi:hypothetical protein
MATKQFQMTIAHKKVLSSQMDLWLRWLICSGLILFLTVLPFHLVIKKIIPGPIGTYWKEVLLASLILLWLMRCLINRQLLLSHTSMDRALLLYLGLLLVRLITDRSGMVASWGFYISVLYLPIFWLITTSIPGKLSWILGFAGLLVGIGALVASGGIAEFILDKTLWPSFELIQRQGFPDVYVYATHLRRVYFIFDSPTTLANTLAIILPLGLALTLVSRHIVSRILSAIASALIAICILFTFSRGIWVSIIISILIMAFLTNQVLTKWKIWIGFITGFAGVLLIGWLALKLGPTRQNPDYKGIAELTSSAFHSVTVLKLDSDLPKMNPTTGQVTTQIWSIYDPIANQEDTRDVIYMHPPQKGKTEVTYQITVPTNGALRFAIAMSPDVWSPEKGDGASFQVFISNTQVKDAGQFIFTRYINPKINPSDRRWRNFFVDLSPWEGQSVYISLVVDCGPSGNWDYDWAGWANLSLVEVEKRVFNTLPGAADEISGQHAASILDWRNDETNQDRLAAWNLSLNTWLSAPLWGKGLGTTGVAALNTQPERALVTESQLLKALTELGIPGILIFTYLWFEIARLSIHSYRKGATTNQKMVILGLMTCLMITFIEGCVYQNLEVKQVNAYFWTLVGLTALFMQENKSE